MYSLHYAKYATLYTMSSVFYIMLNIFCIQKQHLMIEMLF